MAAARRVIDAGLTTYPTPIRLVRTTPSGDLEGCAEVAGEGPAAVMTWSSAWIWMVR